jgi:hypothetical protein
VSVGSAAASVNGSAAAASSEQPAGAGNPAAAGLEFVRKRPEVLVGAAFAGGMIAAFLLRRLGH